MIPLAPTVLVLALPLLAGCGRADDDSYPRLLPLDQLTAEPAVPAHASDAIADPDSVRGELRARADAARGTVPAPTGANADVLARRAEALRARAAALRDDDPGRDVGLPPCPPGTVPDPSATDPARTCTPA